MTQNQIAAPKKAGTRKRRSQAERSGAMRERLIKATLDCLAKDGYMGTTVSSIVKHAGVSRGAHVHHYPTKDALILDAAGYLLKRAYRILGDVLLGIANEDDRLRALMNATWSEIFDTRMFRAFYELLLASQHDAALARALQKLMRGTQQALRGPIGHYFEARGTESESLPDMFTLTVLVMGGMTATHHLSDKSNGDAERLLGMWTRLMVSQMRPRKGVTTPPPRPEEWSRAVV